MDLADNYQIHQLGQTAISDHEEGRWISLANRPDQIRCYHFSATPKPSNLLLGDINKDSCGDHMWPDFENQADRLNDASSDYLQRAEELSEIIYARHQRRAAGFHSLDLDWNQDELVRHVANEATKGYLKDFFNDVWPNFMHMIWTKLIGLLNDEEENKCRVCGNQWTDIGCPQHVLFTCPSIQWVSFKSWQKCGPGTNTGINVTDQDWVAIVKQFESNPFAPKTGIVLKIKLAYMDSLLDAYKLMGILESLDKTRHEKPLAGRGKEIMN